MTVLTDEDQRFLDFEEVSGHEIKAMKALRSAGCDLEPTQARYGITDTMAEKLVSRGLAEKGAPDDKWQRRGYDVGYKLSNLGWAVLERGAKPSNYKRPQSRLAMLKPPLQELQPRLKSFR